jgi:probable F420-dependent oxidoreductase
MRARSTASRRSSAPTTTSRSPPRARTSRTTRLRLGTLVSPATFRAPALLANAAATVDHISGGRVELGIGAGWMEREHRAYGFPFPDTSTRVAMFREQLEIVHRLWTEERVDFHGEHYVLEDAPAQPKPVQTPHPPILVGGAFPYSARRAIRYADGWMPQVTQSATTPLTELIPRFRQMAAEAGRDPATLQINIGGQSADIDLIKRYRDLNVERVSTSLPSEKAETILPVLDRWAEIIRLVNG